MDHRKEIDAKSIMEERNFENNVDGEQFVTVVQ